MVQYAKEGFPINEIKNQMWKKKHEWTNVYIRMMHWSSAPKEYYFGDWCKFRPPSYNFRLDLIEFPVNFMREINQNGCKTRSLEDDVRNTSFVWTEKSRPEQKVFWLVFKLNVWPFGFFFLFFFFLFLKVIQSSFFFFLLFWSQHSLFLVFLGNFMK